MLTSILMSRAILPVLLCWSSAFVAAQFDDSEGRVSVSREQPVCEDLRTLSVSDVSSYR